MIDVDRDGAAVVFHIGGEEIARCTPEQAQRFAAKVNETCALAAAAQLGDVTVGELASRAYNAWKARRRR